MAGFTNKGKAKLLQWAFDGTSLPANFTAALVTSATAPSADTNTMADLTEITGGGYARKTLTLGTSFDAPTEDDGNDRGSLQIVDQVWTASGGALPTTGGARYMTICDATAGSTAEVYAYFDLGSDRQVSSGQTLTVEDAEFRLTE